MAIDPYQPCPCGLDKKIKFCCAGDIVPEIEKIEDALASEQRMVALDLINRALAAHGDRACLYVYKAATHLELREYTQAREDVQTLLAKFPDNPAGRAMQATIDCLEGKPLDGIASLQQALEFMQGKLSTHAYEALGVVGRALALAGETLAARAHLSLQVAASGGQDESAVSGLLELEASGQLPLPAQGLTDLAAPNADGPLSAAGIAEATAALKSAQQGCWALAARRLEELAAKEPGEPTVWRNLGLLYGSLAENEKAVQALRRYASMESVPRDDAVEADAVAQYLSEPAPSDLVPEITTTYSITDASELKEHLLSSRKVQSVPLDPAQFREENTPPPQGMFLLLDREIPANSQGLTRDSVPKILGELLLFGKETDRPARVEFACLKTADFDQRQKALLAMLDRWAGEKLSEEQTGETSAVGAALLINWRFPDDTPVELRRRMMQEHRTAALLSIYPNIPLSTFDGKTARQAAADPKLQVRVQAAILLLDLAEPNENPDYNQLRRSLGLPTLEPIDPASVRVQTLSPARLARVEASKLSDDDLVYCYRRCLMLSSVRLIRKFASEVVARPSAPPEIAKAEVYELLARMTTDIDEMLALVHKAQEAAKAAGESPARYLLAELPVRLQRGEQQEFVRIIDVLRTRHINEPGIAQAVYSLLSQLGLLRGAPGAVPGGAAAMPVSPAAPAAGVWTPDQAPAATQEAGKSKLWLPGMD